MAEPFEGMGDGEICVELAKSTRLRPDVYIDGQVMDPEGCAIRACFDPGEFCDRRTNVDNDWSEPLHRWQARAVLIALAAAGHHVEAVPDARPTPARWHR